MWVSLRIKKKKRQSSINTKVERNLFQLSVKENKSGLGLILYFSLELWTTKIAMFHRMNFWSIPFFSFAFFPPNIVLMSRPQFRYSFSFIWFLIMSSFSVNSAFGEQIFRIVHNSLPIADVWAEIGILVSDCSYWSMFVSILN